MSQRFPSHSFQTPGPPSPVPTPQPCPPPYSPRPAHLSSLFARCHHPFSPGAPLHFLTRSLTFLCDPGQLRRVFYTAQCLSQLCGGNLLVHPSSSCSRRPRALGRNADTDIPDWPCVPPASPCQVSVLLLHCPGLPKTTEPLPGLPPRVPTPQLHKFPGPAPSGSCSVCTAPSRPALAAQSRGALGATALQHHAPSALAPCPGMEGVLGGHCLSQKADRVGLAHTELSVSAGCLRRGVRGGPLATLGFAPKGREPGAPPLTTSTPSFVTAARGHAIWDSLVWCPLVACKIEVLTLSSR